MEFIDTHTHLFSEEYNNDKEEIVLRAIRAGVSRCYLPNIDTGSFADMESLENQFPKHLFSMAGLHPCSVNEKYREKLEFIEKQLARRPFAGIGETGLDFYWDTTFRDRQIESLQRHIGWALQYHLPIILHTREATDATIEVIEPHVPRGLTGIFHCFSGDMLQAEKIISLGFYLGIGGVLTFKNSGLDKVIENISLDHIVLETDSPYLAPVPFRGKRNESSYLPHIARRLADVQQTSLEEVAAITTANARKIFK